MSVLYMKFPRDEVAEWLRRWTANPMGSARVGSNPILVGRFFIRPLNMYNNIIIKDVLYSVIIRVYYKFFWCSVEFFKVNSKYIFCVNTPSLTLVLV